MGETLHLYGNGHDWFVAHTIDEARKLCSELYEDSDPDLIEGDGFMQYFDEESFTLHESDAADILPGTRPVNEWVRLVGEPRHFASVDF